MISADMKRMIRDKIYTDFRIRLLSEAEELQNESEARKQIVFAVSQIRNKTRGNALLLQHNIEYGFTRNLIGGSVVAILVSLLSSIYFFNSDYTLLIAQKITIALSIVYFIILLTSKWLIERNGWAYAKVLYEQYLSL
jgi:hypothetical protein